MRVFLDAVSIWISGLSRPPSVMRVGISWSVEILNRTKGRKRNFSLFPDPSFELGHLSSPLLRSDGDAHRQLPGHRRLPWVSSLQKAGGEFSQPPKLCERFLLRSLLPHRQISCWSRLSGEGWPTQVLKGMSGTQELCMCYIIISLTSKYILDSGWV